MAVYTYVYVSVCVISLLFSFLHSIKFLALRRRVIIFQEQQLCTLYHRNCYDMPVSIVTTGSGERCLSGTNLPLQAGTATKGKTCAHKS